MFSHPGRSDSKDQSLGSGAKCGDFLFSRWVFPKIRGKTQKIHGLFHGKAYSNGWFGGKTPYFLETSRWWSETCFSFKFHLGRWAGLRSRVESRRTRRRKIITVRKMFYIMVLYIRGSVIRSQGGYLFWGFAKKRKAECVNKSCVITTWPTNLAVKLLPDTVTKTHHFVRGIFLRRVLVVWFSTNLHPPKTETCV